MAEFNAASSHRARNTNTPVAGRHPGPDFVLDLPWRLVLENTIVGIGYMQHRRFLWANARMAEIFGYAPGELDGEPVRCLYATREDYEDVGRLMTTQAHVGFVTHERGMACKDGTLIWCRISGRMLRASRFDSPSVWVVQDLSDKKRAEDELRRINQHLEQIVERRTTNLRRTNEALHLQIEQGRELRSAVQASRDKFLTLFRHMPLGVLVASSDGHVFEVNRTLQNYLGATTKARLDELLHDGTRVLLEDGKATSLADLVRAHAAERGQRVDRFEFGWLMPSSRRREISAIAAPLSSRQHGVVFTFMDMTEQRRRRDREHEQQAALAHAARLSLMGRMASALAHELGQPLNATQSYLSGLNLRLADVIAERPEVARALSKASEHLEQAGQIIRNVRGFVSRQPSQFEAVDLPTLVKQTLLLLEVQLRTSRTQVQTYVDESVGDLLPLARCHPVEIQQVLINLVINAVEAMGEVRAGDKGIDIRVHRDSRSMLEVEVSDHGPGVAPELAARVFEPYVTSKPSGLGMGLMICRTIIESHGGALKLIRQKSPGATFRFTLPIWRENE